MTLLPFSYVMGLFFVGLFLLLCFLPREISLAFAVKMSWESAVEAKVHLRGGHYSHIPESFTSQVSVRRKEARFSITEHAL